MYRRIPTQSIAVSIAAFAVLSACATAQPSVVEFLDEVTAATITYSRTPFVLSPDTTTDRERDYVQIGAIEVNRMGTHQYFLWLGISEVRYTESERRYPRGFESIVLVLGGDELQLDVSGWTQEVIGANEPVYDKLFGDTVDAYYEVTTEQIQMLAHADSIRFRTVDPSRKEYRPLFRSITARGDLAEFLRVVSE